MPTLSSRSSRSSKCCLVCGSSDLALFCRKSNRTSVEACTARSFTLPTSRSTVTSSLDLIPSISMTPEADDSIFGLISSATAPGPPSSRSSSMSLPRFARVGSRPCRAALSLTASPMLSVSYPCGFSPSAMVVFPDPGIPVRHTISFDNVWDRQSRYIRACAQSPDILQSCAGIACCKTCDMFVDWNADAGRTCCCVVPELGTSRTYVRQLRRNRF